ncbi:thioredoxin family protein [Streptomyces sp. NPDC001137]|uniref:thioredoxin family protein n=1 Tax=Streptomyces sp. NPDC001137 TaxID=3154378 RepID=UPI003317BD1D
MSVTPITSRTQFKEIVNGSRPVVIHFWAAWSGPCRKIRPVLEELSEDPENSGVVFYTVDVDKLEDIKEEVGVAVVPTFMAFQDGNKLGELRGANPKGLKQLVQQAVETGA